MKCPTCGGHWAGPHEPIEKFGLTLLQNRELWYGKECVTLPPAECRVMFLLMTKDKVAREELAVASKTAKDPFTVAKVRVSYLRRYLRRLTLKVVIETEYSFGWCLRKAF